MRSEKREEVRAIMIAMVNVCGKVRVAHLMDVFTQHYKTHARRAALDAFLGAMETDGLVSCEYDENGHVISVGKV